MQTRPFIQLFKTTSHYYFYDAYVNQISELSAAGYQYLKEHQMIDCFYNEEIAQLYKEGFLHENPILTFQHPATDFVEDLTTRKAGTLVLQITQNCNLRCSYCPYSQSSEKHRHHTNQNMSWETAKKAVDFYYDKSIDADTANISFYGGEPLLQFSLMKAVVAYSKKKFEGKKCVFSITTNATLLTKEIADFLITNEFRLAISLDGDKESNDRNRKFVSQKGSVFEKVIETLQYFYENAPEFAKKINLSMVIDQRKDLKGFLHLFREYPFLNQMQISVSLIEDDYLENEVRESKAFYEEFSYYRFLSYLSVISPLDFTEDLKFFASMKESYKKLALPFQASAIGKTAIPSGQCIPGNTKVMVTVQGKLFPCEKVSERREDYCIGTLDTGYDYEKIREILNFSRYTFALCRNCPAFRECTLCFKTHGAGGFSSTATKMKYCALCKQNFVEDLRVRMYFKEMADWKGRG